jgi:DNA-binding NarL/FixJ family response regulator
MGIKIILADDHQIFREGLRNLILREPGMDVIGEADNGRDAVRMAKRLKPDIVIMDISMPQMNGIEASKILSDLPGLKVIALSMHSDRRYVTAMLKTGVSGYVQKENAFEELKRALGAVGTGKTYLSPDITKILVNEFVGEEYAPEINGSNPLNAREREVLQLLAEGMSTKKIAFNLKVSVKTIESNRRRLMHKLNMDSIAELTKFAIREGLTSLEK